jgi:hypothetical protein
MQHAGIVSAELYSDFCIVNKKLRLMKKDPWPLIPHLHVPRNALKIVLKNLPRYVDTIFIKDIILFYILNIALSFTRDPMYMGRYIGNMTFSLRMYPAWAYLNHLHKM